MISVENNNITNINFVACTECLTFILQWNKGDYDILGNGWEMRDKGYMQNVGGKLLGKRELWEEGEIDGRRT
jgi:hypothetical protein